MEDARKNLAQAYRATSYWVETKRLAIRLRIGERNELLDCLLNDYGATRWAFITAFNPNSIEQPDEVNRNQQARLRRDIARFELPMLDGLGIGDAGDWSPEKSVCVIGIELPAAQRLGETYGQLAVVCGAIGEPARVVYCQT